MLSQKNNRKKQTKKQNAQSRVWIIIPLGSQSHGVFQIFLFLWNCISSHNLCYSWLVCSVAICLAPPFGASEWHPLAAAPWVSASNIYCPTRSFSTTILARKDGGLWQTHPVNSASLTPQWLGLGKWVGSPPPTVRFPEPPVLYPTFLCSLNSNPLKKKKQLWSCYFPRGLGLLEWLQLVQ